MQDQRFIRMQQLKDAIKNKNISRIKQILSLPNPKQFLNIPDKEKQTVIFHAGLHQDQQFGLEVVNLLLENGADPFHREQNKETIIFYLSASNKIKILERLLEMGFNLNDGDQFGWTPLFFAASKGRNKCAQLLIKNGNNVNQLDNNGQTCLFWAAKQGHLQMCKQLINRGCDPLVVDKFKKTASAVARASNHYHVVEYLNLFKKEKNQKIKSNSESMQIEKKVGGGKKKDVPKNEYMLVFTGTNGETRVLTAEQMQQFLKKNNKIKMCLQDTQQLQRMQPPEDHIYKKCSKLITALLKRQDTIAFHEPVKWQQLKLLDYPTLIPQPMDYTTMKSKLMYNCYKSAEDFTRDIHLIYDNCIKYNGPESVYGRLADKLKQEYDHDTVKEFTFFDD